MACLANCGKKRWWSCPTVRAHTQCRVTYDVDDLLQSEAEFEHEGLRLVGDGPFQVVVLRHEVVYQSPLVRTAPHACKKERIHRLTPASQRTSSRICLLTFFFLSLVSGFFIGHFWFDWGHFHKSNHLRVCHLQKCSRFLPLLLHDSLISSHPFSIWNQDWRVDHTVKWKSDRLIVGRPHWRGHTNLIIL